MKANENVLHRAARRFLALDCDERVGKGKGDFSNGKDISKSCKK